MTGHRSDDEEAGMHALHMATASADDDWQTCSCVWCVFERRVVALEARGLSRQIGIQLRAGNQRPALVTNLEAASDEQLRLWNEKAVAMTHMRETAERLAGVNGTTTGEAVDAIVRAQSSGPGEPLARPAELARVADGWKVRPARWVDLTPSDEAAARRDYRPRWPRRNISKGRHRA